MKIMKYLLTALIAFLTPFLLLKTSPGFITWIRKWLRVLLIPPVFIWT